MNNGFRKGTSAAGQSVGIVTGLASLHDTRRRGNGVGSDREVGAAQSVHIGRQSVDGSAFPKHRCVL